MKREWFDNLSKEVLNPDYALFIQSADGRSQCSMSQHTMYVRVYTCIYFFTLECLVISVTHQCACTAKCNIFRAQF